MTRPECAHGQAVGTTVDGLPSCPLCRQLARAAAYAGSRLDTAALAAGDHPEETP